MNVGIVASRYAKALLKYVQENGTGNVVYSQTCILAARMTEVPLLRKYLEDSSDVSLDRKIALIEAALEEKPSPDLIRFMSLATVQGRVNLLHRMLFSFIEQYRISRNIKTGKIVTAVAQEGLCSRLEEIFRDRTGAEVFLQESVDPSILGGFVFELDGVRLDASVEGSLARIRSSLVEKNKRLL